MQAEREIVGGVMSASDVDADAIEIAGRVHRRVLHSAQTYMTAAGPVSVERWLYYGAMASLTLVRWQLACL
jgi:hypothetical protein